ncbi:hypothetical protein EN850_18255 [Mesorhizobium sp. M8A.F.Ca.ET.207.01.1.1]|nr:hypothetical protein EN850_18255 [Mesorhizobium sp. M8A.F.Ca.ET.207.01.1.1]
MDAKPGCRVRQPDQLATGCRGRDGALTVTVFAGFDGEADAIGCPGSLRHAVIAMHVLRNRAVIERLKAFEEGRRTELRREQSDCIAAIWKPMWFGHRRTPLPPFSALGPR